MIQQSGGAIPQSPLELVLSSSPETKIVLLVTALFSLVSWFIIILKWWQFRKLNRQADRFFTEMERTTRLKDAYHAVMKLPPSPVQPAVSGGGHLLLRAPPRGAPG